MYFLVLITLTLSVPQLTEIRQIQEMMKGFNHNSIATTDQWATVTFSPLQLQGRQAFDKSTRNGYLDR